jgi:hypothetical protein
MHFPASEQCPVRIVRGKRVSLAGEQLKRMGLQRGFPDFQFFPVAGRYCFTGTAGRLSRVCSAFGKLYDAVGGTLEGVELASRAAAESFVELPRPIAVTRRPALLLSRSCPDRRHRRFAVSSGLYCEGIGKCKNIAPMS